MSFTIQITKDEADIICYALRELGNRRREQSINYGGEAGRGANQQAETHYLLADRIYEATKPGSPQSTAERGVGAV